MLLSEHDHWILELVVEGRYPLSIFTHPNIDEAVNGRAPKIFASEFASLLAGVYRQDLIDFEQQGQVIRPGGDELVAWVEGGSRISYGLTPRGGEVWEAKAKPAWDRYICASSDGEGEAEAICADRSRVEGFVRSPWQSWVARHGTEHWDALEPWKATYWGKSLSCGHRVRWEYAPEQTDHASVLLRWQNRSAINAWLLDMDDWFTRVRL